MTVAAPPVPFRCPRCSTECERHGDTYVCSGEEHVYPIVLGIPDFRLYEDPLIPLADDYRKGERLQQEAERLTFAELVAFYWTLPTYPATPPDMSARFVHHVLTDRERVATYAHLLGTTGKLLDVGCGAGMLLQTVGGRFDTAVGVDVGFRWLVVARKGLEEVGVRAPVVCACADHLPFGDDAFDTVTSVSLLEHTREAEAVLREFNRVQRPGGRLVTWTSNRFSLTPEPHVGVWGVGFLPRRWMPAYVRWRRGLAYQKKHLLSRFELSRALRRTGFARRRYHLPPVASADLASASAVERWGARIYAVLRRIPGARWFIVALFPILVVDTSKPRDAQ